MAVEASAPAKSTTERVYDSVRADIFGGRLAPGSRLRYVELCERYGASTSVMRGVMLRLSEQGLVHGEPNHGFRVIDLSIEDLRDLTASRIMLESLALRAAVANGDVAWESQLLAAHHRLSRTPMHDPDDPVRLSDSWIAEHAAFHGALLDGCPNRRLKEFAGSLRAAGELYRCWSLPLGLHAKERDVPKEHEDLLNAALARDTELAVELLTAHISTTSNLLLENYATKSAAQSEPSGSPAVTRP